MSPVQVIAAIALVGGGYWLITGVNPLSLLGIDTSAIDSVINPNVAAGAQTLAQQRAQAAQTAQAGSGRAGVAAAIGGAGAAAGVVGSVGGIAASTALLATGIAAAGALLVWGITQRGWFRGGEEGIKVNPARDEFLNVWVQNYYPGTPPKIGDAARDTQVTDPVTGYSGDAQYSAMVRAFHDAGVDGNKASATISQLYAANTMQEFQVAAENFLRVLQGGG